MAALKSDAAAEKSKDQLSRDFLVCSIFDFCKNICHYRKSCLYCGPVLRHSAEPIQAANFRSAVAF